MDHTNTSLNLSVEQTPKKIQNKNVSEFVVNNVDYITIPHLNQNTLKITSESVSQLTDVYGVDPSRVIPHISARSIFSKSELTQQLKNFADIGVKNLLVVGGNPSQSRGPYSSADDVREHIRNFDKFNIYCGVYPDTDEPIDILLNKYSRFNGGFTQLCLSPRKLEFYKTMTRVGIPSQADFDGMYRYMKICGVGPSIRYPLRNILGYARFMTLNGFNTTKLVKAIQPHHTFHVYDFGRIEKTVEDLLDLDINAGKQYLTG